MRGSSVGLGISRLVQVLIENTINLPFLSGGKEDKKDKHPMRARVELSGAQYIVRLQLLFDSRQRQGEARIDFL